MAAGKIAPYIMRTIPGILVYSLQHLPRQAIGFRAGLALRQRLVNSQCGYEAGYQ